MSIKKSTKWLLLIIAAAIYLITNVNIANAKDSKTDELPDWIVWQEKEIKDKNGNTFCLSNKHVIRNDTKNKKIWECNEEYLVQDEIITDLDRNNEEELILLVWKKGRYGKNKPFWVKEDENKYSQHIFIYSIENNGKVTPKWFASDIGRYAARIKIMEKNEAVVLIEDLEGRCTLWMWDSFGLKNIENEVKFISFGDNIIHENIYKYAYAKEKGNFDFLYEPFKKEIETADIATIGAETILVDKKEAVSGYPRFGSPLAVGEAIKNAGFDVAVCANNHALDRGINGINTTSDFYKENGIICIGIQNSHDKEYKPYETLSKNGIRFGLFSYTYGTNDIDVSEKYPYAVHYLPKNENEKSAFIKEINDAKKDVDIIVVFVHWGEEYNKEITEEQNDVLSLLKKTKADVIIGSHPHVVQKTEMLKRDDGGDILVYYSLGNFRADQGQSKETKTGAEAVFTVEHTYDGIEIKKWDTNEINAYWRE